MIKNILKVLPILLILFVLFTADAKAGSPIPLNGYAWSDTIGWLSFNGTDGGNVTLSTTTVTDATISGYAWSENIGWVSFNETTGCPVGVCKPTVNLSSGAVSGWIRACAGTISGDCVSASRTDGWDGWIELAGTNHVSPILNGTGGVTFDSTTGKFKGYAWGDVNVGWLSFDSGITNGKPVSCDPDCGGGGGGGSLSCSITAVSPTATQVNINYTINNDPNKTNYKLIRNTTTIQSGISTGSGSSYTPVTFNDTGLSPNTTYTYSLATSSIPLCTSASVTTQSNPVDCNLTNSCPVGGGTGELWLGTDSTKKLKTMKVTSGKTVQINWITPTGEDCSVINSKYPSSATNISQFDGDVVDTTSNITTDPLVKGKYDLSMSCVKDGITTNIPPVQIIVTDSSTRER